MNTVNKEKASNYIAQFKGSVIVSCQPVDDGPMDKTEHIVAMALAAIDGGAKGLRIEGVENVSAVASAIKGAVPIIGIVKRDLEETDEDFIDSDEAESKPNVIASIAEKMGCGSENNDKKKRTRL